MTTQHPETLPPDLAAEAEAGARIVFVPGGGWAACLAEQLGEMLGRPSGVALRHGVVNGYDVALMALPTGLAPTGCKSLWVASGLSVLPRDPQALPQGAALLVHASQTSPAALVNALDDRQRQVLVERSIALHWVDALAADGPVSQHQFSERLAQAAAALLGLDSGANLASESLHRLSEADLTRQERPPEVDFRAEAHALTMPEPAEQADPSWRRAAWRFHLRAEPVYWAGGPAAGAAVVPAALHALGQQQRQRWLSPLVVHGADPGPVAQPLGDLASALAGERLSGGEVAALCRVVERASATWPDPHLTAERLGSAAAEVLEGDGAADASVDTLVRACPEDAELIPVSPEAPLMFHLATLRAIRSSARAGFVAELERLSEALERLLRVDDSKDPKRREAAAVAATMGAAAGELMDLSTLGPRLPDGGSTRLSGQRRRRIEAALWVIQASLQTTMGLPHIHVVLPEAHALLPEGDAPQLLGPGAQASFHDSHFVAAGRVFDDHVDRMMPLFAATRTARMELSDSYVAEVHDEALGALEWEALTADELAVAPAVVVVSTAQRVRDAELGQLSALLRSSRPIQVLVVDPTDGTGDLRGFHADLGYLAVAHREAFVVQGSLARPEALVAALADMARALRPGVAVLAAPPATPSELRKVRLEAALHGRVCPVYRYDPDAGRSWADRFDVADNPAPAEPWPQQAVDYRGGQGAATLSVAFTFADAAALESAFRKHLCVIAPSAWSEEQQLLEHWLADVRTSLETRRIPFVWVVDDTRTLQRAVVTRELAFACRDRLRAWHVLQELGGFDNAYAERALAAGRQDAEREAARTLAEAQRRHQAELEDVRRHTARDAMRRLAEVLLDPTSQVHAPGAHLVTRVDEGPPPAVAEAAPPSAAASGEQQPDEADEDDLIVAEAYVESVLCTSCNDCINLNTTVFRYNAEKQAYIVAPSKAPFEILVRAAEACAANCIFPGPPRTDDPTVTPELIERAKGYS